MSRTNDVTRECDALARAMKRAFASASAFERARERNRDDARVRTRDEDDERGNVFVVDRSRVDVASVATNEFASAMGDEDDWGGGDDDDDDDDDDIGEALDANANARSHSTRSTSNGTRDLPSSFASVDATARAFMSVVRELTERRARAESDARERKAAAALGASGSGRDESAKTSGGARVDGIAQDVLVQEIVTLRAHVTRVNAERDRLIEMSNDLRAALHKRTRARAMRAASAARDGDVDAALEAEDAICMLWEHNKHLASELRRAQAVIRGRDRLIERERDRESAPASAPPASAIPIVEATPAVRTKEAHVAIASSQRETASQRLKLKNALLRAKERRAAPRVRNWNVERAE